MLNPPDDTHVREQQTDESSRETRMQFHLIPCSGVKWREKKKKEEEEKEKERWRECNPLYTEERGVP